MVMQDFNINSINPFIRVLATPSLLLIVHIGVLIFQALIECWVWVWVFDIGG